MIELLQVLIFIGLGWFNAHHAGASFKEDNYASAFVSAWFALGMLAFIVVMSVQYGALS